MSNTAANSPDELASPTPLSAPADVPRPPLQRARSPHPSQKHTLGDGGDCASAKPTICRRLEINDRPKPDGSSSRSAASPSTVTAPTGPPSLPSFPQIYTLDLCQSRWTAAWSVDLVVEARPRPRGGEQVEPAVSCCSQNWSEWSGNQIQLLSF